MTRRRPNRPTHAGKPLRRKPKQLTEDPSLFRPEAGGGAGAVARAGGARGPGRGRSRPGSSQPAFTDERGEVLDTVPVDAVVDRETLARARQIAARLSIARPRQDVTARRGVGELASLRYAGGSDDIDLDATLERLVEHPVPDDDDIVVRERVRTRRSVVLAVDVSGSMRGERVRTAAATVGALAGELVRDDLAVVAFWSDAAVTAPLGRVGSPARVLDTLLRIPARGLTNVAFPLQVAHRELARVPARDARVLLLTDAVHNAGPDPRTVVGRLPRVDVLLDTSGEHDADLGRDLARLGRGRFAAVATHRDVAPALRRLFAT